MIRFRISVPTLALVVFTAAMVLDGAVAAVAVYLAVTVSPLWLLLLAADVWATSRVIGAYLYFLRCSR